jgi:hypothetical protein
MVDQWLLDSYILNKVYSLLECVAVYVDTGILLSLTDR